MRLVPDELAVSALSRDDATVLPTDPDDRADLADLRRIVTVGRTLTPADAATDDPPADLWGRIATSITEADDGPATVDTAPEPVGGAQVVRLESRRRTWQVLATVAAALVLVVAAAGIIVNRSSGSGTELVASTDLALLEGGGSGSAELLKRSDGMHLVVDVADLSPAERADFYELWLLTPDGKDPQSLTKFTKQGGTIDVALPPGVSTTKFPVVDISEEIDDGDNSHSGKSILRGSLA